MRSDIGGALIQIVFLGPVNGNGENSGRDTQWVSETNPGEAGAVEGRREVVYTGGGGSAGISWISLGHTLHRTKTGNGGTVGGAAENI